MPALTGLTQECGALGEADAGLIDAQVDILHVKT